jgi:beta-phosphoglucomutase
MRVVGVGDGALLARADLTIASFEQLDPVFLLSHIGLNGPSGRGDCSNE